MKISLDKTIRAMSIALDLAEISSMATGDIVEEVSNVNYSEHKFLHHSLRVAYIGLEIGKELGLDDESLKELYITTLLHDIGACNSLKESHYNINFIEEHCIKGADITKAFPLFKNVSSIILYHHENYDGSGPLKLKEDSIPIESQIVRVADLVEVSYDETIRSFKQKEKISSFIKSNINVIFSPKIAEAFLKISEKELFWFNLESIGALDFILDNIRPKLDIYIDLNQFEDISYIFSKIIDSKSKFTAKHSIEIGNLAYKVSKFLGYDEEKCLKMKIAGLLHDIGKLAIPTIILDKNASLTEEEFSIIKSHVYYTKIILDRIEDIADIARWASNHHEKLNSKGYPSRLSSEELCMESRILGVCDIYQALTEDRPYRNGLDCDKAFSILDGMIIDGHVCSEAVNHLKNALFY